MELLLAGQEQEQLHDMHMTWLRMFKEINGNIVLDDLSYTSQSFTNLQLKRFFLYN